MKRLGNIQHSASNIPRSLSLPRGIRERSAFRCGFTLIEVVISAALMSLILVSAYACFSAAIGGRKTMEPRLEVIQNARVAMALMSADLRGACPLDKESDFLGMHRTLGESVADNIDFATHNYTPHQANEGDFCQMSYYLDRNEVTGQLSLFRRRNPVIAPDSLSGGSKEEIATGIKGLQFEYSDGIDWYDSWGDVGARGKKQTSQKEQPNLTGMPEAVRITLSFDADPHRKNEAEPAIAEEKPQAPMVFQTVVCLTVRPPQNNSSDSSSDGQSTGQSGQTPDQSGAEGMVQ